LGGLRERGVSSPPSLTASDHNATGLMLQAGFAVCMHIRHKIVGRWRDSWRPKPSYVSEKGKVVLAWAKPFHFKFSKPRSVVLGGEGW